MGQGNYQPLGPLRKGMTLTWTKNHILSVTQVPPGSQGTSAERMALSHRDSEGKP